MRVRKLENKLCWKRLENMLEKQQRTTAQRNHSSELDRESFMPMISKFQKIACNQHASSDF